MELRNFYKFVPIQDNLITIQKSIFRLGEQLNIKGTILLAEEGINASISGHTGKALIALQTHIETLLGTTCTALITDLSKHNIQALPFRKFKVRIRSEIVTMRVDNLDPACDTGVFVDPQNWNELITDPATITIDTRNIYEYLIGHFKGATNPNTPTFHDFIDYVHNNMDNYQQYKNIAMYCTGGIRCEKASSFMKTLGIHNLYQLHGGILRYFEQIPQEDNLWEGACFVFDDRIAINTDMSPSTLQYQDIPPALHDEKLRSRHSGHVYKKIMSITQA